MKKAGYLFILFLLAAALPGMAFAQKGAIKGKVVDAKSGQALPGANIMIVGTTMGTASNQNGEFEISNLLPGKYTIKVNYIGYVDQTRDVRVRPGQTTTINFKLSQSVMLANAIEIVADRALERETPVAFTNVDKDQMEIRLGSRDVPLVLNTTPSVYATQQGGGSGDARINIRGFDQRNIAIMINGVPVNDMENGWVYWSNWDGISDATASIQVQRGLSAVNLATASVGGTMNIITSPTRQEFGLRYKQEFGSGNFMKTTLTFNSGLINNKFAFNGLLVRKTADGIIDKTWTDAWAYYFGASWNINKNNRLELYAVGAPQRHGQNLYKQNIATYSKSFAEGLADYDTAAFKKFKEAGRTFNQNWAPVDPSYKGKQMWDEHLTDRYNPNYLMERENFFHKPQINLNWYSNLTDKLSIYNVAYYSGGHGGGTGTIGKIYRRDANGKLGGKDYKFYKGPSPWQYDWNETIKVNESGAGDYYVDKRKIHKEDGQSIGVLRNSRNNQWTIGDILRGKYKVSDQLTTNFGIDWRTAQIEHYREVRDLLGGKYFVDKANEYDNTPDKQKKRLGDKIAYFNTNTVDWLGVYAQGEYKTAVMSVYGMAGYSMIKYGFTDHFRTSKKLADGSPDVNSPEFTLKSNWITGMQVKGGASYRMTENIDFYANAGYITKVPIFDNVIDDRTGTLAKNYKNEKYIDFEAGVNSRLMDGRLKTKADVYNTLWKDRSRLIGIVNQDGTEGVIVLSGMNALHQGIEFEAGYQPMSLFNLSAAASFGNWKMLDDVSGVYRSYDKNAHTVKSDTANYYVKDLKVGDAPQTQFALVGTVYPIHGMRAQIVYRYYMRNYSYWDPFSRSNPKDRKQSWKAPDYGVMDLHFSYNLPVTYRGVRFQFFTHVFNVFDSLYIQDARDNSRYNAWDHDHDADDAEVFFGPPRFFNVGFSVSY